jgi:hypothetical protein
MADGGALMRDLLKREDGSPIVGYVFAFVLAAFLAMVTHSCIGDALAQTDQAAQFKKTMDQRKKASAMKKKIEKRAADRAKAK